MYVEAFKESHVAEAVRGLRNVLISRGVRLVPLKEMVDAITVNTKAKKIVGALVTDCWQILNPKLQAVNLPPPAGRIGVAVPNLSH